MATKSILALDVGTSSVKGILGIRTSKGISLQVMPKEKSLGLRNGAVEDPGEATQAIAKIIGVARKISKASAKNIYVNVGTHHIESKGANGIHVLRGGHGEIYEEDVQRVLKASQDSVNVSKNRLILHTIEKSFSVDDLSGITNPINLVGRRLEVDALIIHALVTHVENLFKSIKRAGGEVAGIVSNPMSIARSALTKRQKELGTVIVDIGGGTTDVCIYEEGRVLNADVFPVGSDYITQDIAVALKVPINIAERIKIHYGYAVSKKVNSKDSIELSKLSPDLEGSVSRRYVSEIIGPRFGDIFDFVNESLSSIDRQGKLAGGVVLVGGGSKMPGVVDLAKSELKLSAQLGMANTLQFTEEGSTIEELEDSEFVNATGLLLWGGDEKGWWSEDSFADISSNGFDGGQKTLKRFFKSFLT